MKATYYVRTRIVNLKLKTRYTYAKIKETLSKEDGVILSRKVIARVWNHFRHTGLITPIHTGGRNYVLTPIHKDFIDEEMTKNSELTGYELMKSINNKFGLKVSVSTVLRARRKLGWKFTGTRYCQMISEKNRQARYKFAVKCLRNKEVFDDVVFTDETKINMECHTRRQCRKEGTPIRQQLRAVAKHPYSVSMIKHIINRFTG